MTYVKVKGQSRSNVVKNVLLLPTLARRIFKQVKDDDDLYEGQRSTEVISGQGTSHRDDTVMSSFVLCFVLFLFFCIRASLMSLRFLLYFHQGGP